MNLCVALDLTLLYGGFLFGHEDVLGDGIHSRPLHAVVQLMMVVREEMLA